MAERARNIELARVVEWDAGQSRRLTDYLAAEEPLEIRSGRRSLGVTLRTPGNDDELAAGFLFTEGIVTDPKHLTGLRLPDGTPATRNLVRVTMAPSVRVALNRTDRKFSAGSACGVCGKASIAQLRRRGLRRPDSSVRFEPEILCQMPPKLRSTQAVFGRTGGLHAAALFDAQGDLVVLREDIGRHNAVDKVIGWAFLRDRLPLKGHALMVSGRSGFEIVQKALAAGIPVLASVSAPSSLAVQLARELGLTLVGFLRGSRFVIYSGEERIAVPDSSDAG